MFLAISATATTASRRIIRRQARCSSSSSSRSSSPKAVKEQLFLRRQKRLDRDEQSHAAETKVPLPPRREALLASRLTDNFLDQPTVWHEFSPLATQHQAINLGQGFPDWDPPHFVIEALHQAAAAGISHQYARSAAHMPLAEVLAQIYSERWNTTIDPSTQIATTVGCTQALYCALQGLVDPGDEVVMFEPAFDIYDAQVKLADGVSVFVPLRRNNDDDGDAGAVTKEGADEPSSSSSSSSVGADGGSALRNSNQVFQIDWDALEVALSRKPRILILNTPHNPTGKIFTTDELVKISQLLSPETTVITDEVYEYLVFDGHEHTSMANLLPNQTLTLSSAGKTFSCTGWKVGWAVGPAPLVRAVAAVQQWVNFSAPTPNQQAIAQCLIEARHSTYVDPEANLWYDNYYQYLSASYQRKRDILVEALQSAGMTPIVPPGGFFVMADTASIEFPYVEQYQDTTTASMPYGPMPRDWALARWLTETVGVTAIPPCNFYSPRNRHELAPNLLRFAFCKSDDTLREGHRRLANYFGGKV